MDQESECRHVLNVLKGYKDNFITLSESCLITRLIFISTAKCDHMKGAEHLPQMRESFKSIIDNKSLINILKYNETYKDANKALHAVLQNKYLF